MVRVPKAGGRPSASEAEARQRQVRPLGEQAVSSAPSVWEKSGVSGETRHSSDIIEGCPPAPGRRAVGAPATRTLATNTPPATLCSASGSAR